MGHFFDWYNKNNTQLIQGLFVLVGLMLIAYLVKIFWGAKEPQNSELDSEQFKSFEQKLQQVLDQNKSSMTATAEGGPQSEEMEKLRSEIYTLRQTLKEKEDQAQRSDIIAAPAATMDPANGAVPESAAGMTATETNSEEIASYKKKIEELENRLSDYEVIAEDISDLHRLREENEKLKAQVSGGGSIPAPAEKIDSAVIEEVPLVESVNELAAAEEPVAESKPISSEDLAQSIDEILAQSSVQPTSEEIVDSNEPVSEEAKKLLSDFEKSKG